MKKIYFLLALNLVVAIGALKATNVVIIQSPGYAMATSWQTACQALGYTSTIVTSAELNTNQWFDTTDILVVTDCHYTLTPAQIDTIQSFLLHGGNVYMQAEYLDTFYSNVAFQQIVNATGGSFTWDVNSTAGQLVPMYVSGSLSTTPYAIDSLPYYWYGDAGTWGNNSHIEPFLLYQCEYYGFIYCCPLNNARMIAQSDQDWIQDGYGIPLIENILSNLASPTYACVENTGNTSLSINLGPDTTICNNSFITLNGTTLGATSYFWSNNATTATITVNTAGTYWVEASNSCNTVADTIQISTASQLQVNLGNDTTICSSNSITLNGAAQGATGYLWSNNATTPAITVNTAGTYWVRASNACSTAADTIQIATSASLVVNLGPDTTICPSHTITLNGTTPGATGYLWNNNAVTSTITINSTGTYWVAVSGGCGIATDTIHITAGASPIINLGNDTAICSNQTVQLNAGNAGSTWLWSNNAQTQTVTVSPGSYSVTVTNRSGCFASDSIVINEYQLTDTVISSPALCNEGNGSLLISGLPANHAPYTYSWNNGATTALDSNLTYGTYTATVSDLLGCTANITATVGISHSITINSTPDSVTCLGDSISICAPSGFVAYGWSNGETGQCIFVLTSGVYYATVTDAFHCSAYSNHLNIQVVSPPQDSVVTHGDTLTCITAGTYQWLLNGHTMQGDTGNRVIATQNGSYQVMVTNPQGCSSISNAVNITIPTGINTLNAGAYISVYPNPLTSGNLQMDVNENLLGSLLEMFDVGGKLVYKSEIRSLHSELELKAARGVYILEIHAPEGNYNLKLIKLN